MVRKNAIAFCDQFGAEAQRLGWTALEFFAVHPKHGTIRPYACGALMIGGEPTRGVDATGVVVERTTSYRDGLGQA